MPTVPGTSHPVDAFVRARLVREGLTPSREADRRTLLRRLSIDLTGLVPTPEELAAYVGDQSPEAYERQVDRLLASPCYGERMAQQWLALAHYADSHGQDQDRARPNAWPYRDYLIRSFNHDKPYPLFVREQVAGDILFPGDPGALEATGFLAAGPWDESGLRDIREDALDRITAQYLDRDDIVSSTFSVFMGLTVGCARCHDHKFDPIPQADYYALQAVFAGTDKAERTYDADPAVASARTALAKRLEEARAWRTNPGLALANPSATAAVQLLQASHSRSEALWMIPEPLGWKSGQGATLKVLPDRSILSMGKRPEKDTTTVRLALRAGPISSVRLEVIPDETLPLNGPGRCDNGNLHLSEIRLKLSGKALKIATAMADFDQTDWGIAKAIDGNPDTAWGIHPQVGKAHQAIFLLARPVEAGPSSELEVELDQLHGRGHLIGRLRLAVSGDSSLAPGDWRPFAPEIAAILARPEKARTDAQRAELRIVALEQQLQGELDKLPVRRKVYCGTSQYSPEGSFKPALLGRPVHLLRRGDSRKPGEEAVPGALSALGFPSRFPATLGKPEGERRMALAGWLSHADNGLLWRVMANRVWAQHFGDGIVSTPNDLGKMGGTPSHPELLEWLASEFKNRQGSLKALHRLVVTSSTYRQVSSHRDECAAKDAGNRLLWRMSRQRLDAETVRDALLQVSGRLDGTLYGPPVKLYVETASVHVTPQADYLAFNPDGAGANRRSLYRFIFRTRPDPFLGALDCPDASQSVPTRTESASPLQALALWNNVSMLKGAEYLAGRARGLDSSVAGSVAVATRLVLLREPTPAESSAWTTHARKHGLASVCRVLLNTSEFLYVE